MTSVSPARRRSPAGRRDATCRARPRRPCSARERLATKNVSAAAISAPRRLVEFGQRLARAGGRARGVGRRVWMYCAQLPKLCAIRTVRPSSTATQAAVGAVAPAGGEVEADQADRLPATKPRRGGIVCRGQGSDAQRRRIGRLHEARRAAQHRGHRPAALVERRGEQVGQQGEEGAVLVGHEGPDGGAACALARPAPAPRARPRGRTGRPNRPAGSCEALRLLGELRLRVVPGGARRIARYGPAAGSATGVSRQPSRSRTTGCAVRSAMRCEPHRVQKRRNLPGEDSKAPSSSRPRTQRNFSARHGRHRREGRAMGLAAGLAMAMHDALERCVGLVGDAAAQAASGQHGRLLRVVGPQHRNWRLRR